VRADIVSKNYGIRFAEAILNQSPISLQRMGVIGRHIVTYLEVCWNEVIGKFFREYALKFF